MAIVRILQLYDRCAALRHSSTPAANTIVDVMKLSSSALMTGSPNPNRHCFWKLAWPDAFDHSPRRSHREGAGSDLRQILRGRCPHQAARCRDGRLLIRRQRRGDHYTTIGKFCSIAAMT